MESIKLDKQKLKTLFEQERLSEEVICCYANVTKRELSWIMQNGFAQITTAVRLATMVGVELKEISLSDSTQSVKKNCVENVIEFLKDQDTATVTFSQGRYISKVRKLAEERPEECKILVENKDGSIVAHVPVDWVKISPPPILSDEQREAKRLNILKVIANQRQED